MSYTNETTNLHLPLYVDSDKPSYLGDWNQAMESLDTGYAEVKTLEQNVEALETTVGQHTTQINANTQSIAANTQKITQLENAVNRFQKVGFIGDSWGVGYYNSASHPSQGWPVYLAQALGISQSNYYNASVSGSGIVGTADQTFSSQVATLQSEIPDAECIIIMGGQNDRNQVGTSGIDTWPDKCAAFFDTLEQAFPNAEKHFFLCPLGCNHFDNTTGTVASPYLSVVNGLMLGARGHNVYLHNGCVTWGDWVGTANADSDTRHLLASGYQMVGELMAQLVLHGGDFWRTGSGLLILPEAITVASGQYRCFEQNGIVDIEFGGQYTGETITATTGGSPVTLATLPDYFGSLQRRFLSTIARDTDSTSVQLRLDGQNLELVSGTITQGSYFGFSFQFPTHS